MASLTISGGYFLPSYQTGSSSLSQISVSIGPGFTSATWVFEPARSFHRPSLKAFMAALEAAYIASRGGGGLAAEGEEFDVRAPAPPRLGGGGAPRAATPTATARRSGRWRGGPGPRRKEPRVRMTPWPR